MSGDMIPPGFDPSQIASGKELTSYALFAGAAAFVIWLLKQARELLTGNSTKSAVESQAGEIKSTLGSIMDTLKRQDEGFATHRKETRENEIKIFDTLVAVKDDIGSVKERVATLEGANRQPWTEEERQRNRNHR